MSESVVTVGFLLDGDSSPEQHAALEWCAEAGIDVETVSLTGLAADIDVASTYDVLWWHRTESVTDVASLSDVSEAVKAYLEDGGGLLLSLRALEAVPEFAIDPVGPDVSLLEESTTTTGLLWKSLYDDHPAIDGLESLRLRTRTAEGTQPCARYEHVLPERGTVLASTLREDGEVPHEVALVGWRVGEGDVIGLGTGIQFDVPVTDEADANRSCLLSNLLAVLGDDERQVLEQEPRTVKLLSSNREKLADDHHRPQYHLSPPGNWLNDPNGMIKWNGKYHAFYQYNPGGPYHGTIHWGHAVSEDLVTWEDWPIALAPSPDGPDRDGCWSGCAVNVDGTPMIMYTGGRDDMQLPCLGVATDEELTGWEKHPENPIIKSVPAEPTLRSTEHWQAEFRDHNIWHEDGVWYHLIGSGVENAGGTALLYTCEDDDMTDWTYHGPILIGDPGRDGEMWECPELLDLGEKQLLHISNYEEVRYYLGEYEEGSFDVEQIGLLDHGSFYAPQSLRDDDGRWLTWGWVKPDRNLTAQWDAGWSGTLSLPRYVDLDADGRLRQRPAPELAELRKTHAYGGSAVLDNEQRRLRVNSRSFELRTEIRLDDTTECGLTVRESPDGVEETVIRYLKESNVVVDRSASTTDPRASDKPVSMPVTPADETLSLRVFVDGSVMELFANDHHCLTTRIFPTREDSNGISIYAANGAAAFEELDVWEMGSAWSEADARTEQSTRR